MAKYYSSFLLFTGFILISGCTAETPHDFRIVYNVLYDGYNDDYEIFMMNPDGSGQINISNNPALDWVYYASGDRVYFISDRDTTSRNYFLYEMKWDGSEVRRVTDFLVHDSWIGGRKNGRELVVVPKLEEEETRDLYIINLEGEILQQITDDEYRNQDPFFSPDGERVVFRSYRTGRDELFVMNTDGSELQRLTYYPDSDTTAEDWAYHAGPPFWVDDNTISYISKQEYNYSIYTLKLDSDSVKQLTASKDDQGYYLNQGWHSWSRDGSQIAYNAATWRGNYDIYLMNADGSNIRRLTEGEIYEQAPVFVYPEVLD